MINFGFNPDHRFRSCQGPRKVGILSAETVLPAWQHPNMEKRPLPLAYEQHCIFCKHATDSLDAENIPWDLAFVSASCVDCIPCVSADLASVAVLQGPSRKIGKKSAPVQAFPLYPNSWFIFISLMGWRARWRTTLPVLPAMPSCIRSITGHEMG